MPAPKRANPDDFFDQLPEAQQSHLAELRRISLEFADEVTEELRWNTPAYIHKGKFQWMLQAYKNHCSLRFTPEFFGPHRAEVDAAEYPSGEGFLKIPYDMPVPADLCRSLIRARLDEAQAV